MTAYWYCVQVRADLFATAQYNLKRQGFESFWPRIVIKRPGSNSQVQQMFRGYGFVRIDLTKDRWLSVNGTKGVIGLLPRFAETPSPMHCGFMEALIANDPMKESEFLQVFDDFVAGDLVEIGNYHHFLSGQKGTVVSIRTKMLQIALSGELFSKGVWIDRAYINPINSE
jgi:transcription antitermination factor NusG